MARSKKSKRSRKLSDQKFHGEAHETIKTPFFSLKVRANNTGENRIGVVVGVAVHKSAVKRNFWKRQVRETTRGIKKMYGDILVMLFPKVNDLTKKQFREALLKSFDKL